MSENPYSLTNKQEQENAQTKEEEQKAQQTEKQNQESQQSGQQQNQQKEGSQESQQTGKQDEQKAQQTDVGQCCNEIASSVKTIEKHVATQVEILNRIEAEIKTRGVPVIIQGSTRNVSNNENEACESLEKVVARLEKIAEKLEKIANDIERACNRRTIIPFF